jgi:hypothetical protein
MNNAPPDPISSAALCWLMSLNPGQWPQCMTVGNVPGRWLKIGEDSWIGNGSTVPESDAYLAVDGSLPEDQRILVYNALNGSEAVTQMMLGPTSNEVADIFFEDEIALQNGGRALNLVALRAASYLQAQMIDAMAQRHTLSWPQAMKAVLGRGFRPVDGWMAAIATPSLYFQGPDSATAADVGIAWMVARNVLAAKVGLATTDMQEPPLFPNEITFLADFAGAGAGTYPKTPLAIFRQPPPNPVGGGTNPVAVKIYRDDALWNSTDQSAWDFGGLVARAFQTLYKAINTYDLETSGTPGPGTPGPGPEPGPPVDPTASAKGYAASALAQASALATSMTSTYTADPTNVAKGAAFQAANVARDLAVVWSDDPTSVPKMQAFMAAWTAAQTAVAAAGAAGGGQVHPTLDLIESFLVEGVLADVAAAAKSAVAAAAADPTNKAKAHDAALATAKAAAADPTNKAKADAAKKAAAAAKALQAGAGAGDGTAPTGMGTGARVGIAAAVVAVGWVGLRVATKKPVWPF